jgi:hypothetical protein
MRLGNADECFRLGFIEALAQVFYSHARIDQHRDSADFEKREGQSEEFQAGFDH